MMPAACIGEMTNAISGTASKAKPPNPPLETPVIRTEKTATPQKTGS